MENAIIQWWAKARPFFEEHAPSILPQLDDESARFQKLTAADSSFRVCVLGQSAVGKSTLLNAIVARDETVLPAGGIGPLTALATEVRYSEDPYFLVTYRDKKQLSGFRLQVEKELKSQGVTHATFGDETEQDFDELEPLEGTALQTESTGELFSQIDPKHADTAFGELTKQLTQLITGAQFATLSLSDILIGFRAILGVKGSDASSLPEADQNRIRSAARTIASRNPNAPTQYFKSAIPDTFDTLLQDHVSGHLAPLVERIEVGYPASALRQNVVLVDLPGIGIANDRYRSVTTEYIRVKASAVILVVDRGGPTEASVNLIRDSGYWDRLLLSSEDPERDPCDLIIAVTQIDNVAKQTYMDQKLPKDQRLSLPTIFDNLCDLARRNIREQATNCFYTLSRGQTSDEEVIASRESARQVVLAGLEVFPVSAPEYRALLANDEFVRPFIKDETASGIPHLVQHIDRLAEQHQLRLDTARRLVLERLHRNVEASLAQITAQWSANSRAAEEAEELRSELRRFLEPKRLELANRTGAFREFLELSGSTKIAELVAKAQIAAQTEVSYYLRQLQDVHWATLRATVVRGGAYVSGRGVRVDLPADVAQRFQEPMAGIWGRTLLKDIRLRTKQYGKNLETVITEICRWADSRSDTIVQRSVLAAQQQLMKDRVEQLGEVGSEAVEELKNAIKMELMTTIEQPIRDRCEEFRNRGDAAGPGVKNRILELFNSLAAEAVAAAAGPATMLLQNQFQGVRLEIVRALEDWGDPIQQASDAIVEREEQRRLRSDAQRRRHILTKIEELQTELHPVGEEPLNESVA